VVVAQAAAALAVADVTNSSSVFAFGAFSESDTLTPANQLVAGTPQDRRAELHLLRAFVGLDYQPAFRL
jgi:hypothetical protein